MNLTEQINHFADLAKETSGGSFSITKICRDNLWQVSFTSKGQSFTDPDISVAIQKAEHYLLDNRRIIYPETKYTLYR